MYAIRSYYDRLEECGYAFESGEDWLRVLPNGEPRVV